MFFSKEDPSKGKIIGYWIATVILAGGTTASGMAALMKVPDVVKVYQGLGYPLYFMTLLGTAKVLGAITVIIPKFPRLKEWAYAGLCINFTSAFVSHVASGDPIAKIAPPLVFLAICLTSYFLRPPSRVVIE